MKSRTPDWIDLAGAAVAAKDALRSRLLPACDQLARLPLDAEAIALLSDIRATACGEANRLRHALKGRQRRGDA